MAVIVSAEACALEAGLTTEEIAARDLSPRAQWRRIVSGTRAWFRHHPDNSAAVNIVTVGLPGPEPRKVIRFGRFDRDGLASCEPDLSWQAIDRGLDPTARARRYAGECEAAIVGLKANSPRGKDYRRAMIEDFATYRREAEAFRPAWG